MVDVGINKEDVKTNWEAKKGANQKGRNNLNRAASKRKVILVNLNCIYVNLERVFNVYRKICASKFVILILVYLDIVLNKRKTEGKQKLENCPRGTLYTILRHTYVKLHIK